MSRRPTPTWQRCSCGPASPAHLVALVWRAGGRPHRSSARVADSCLGRTRVGGGAPTESPVPTVPIQRLPESWIETGYLIAESSERLDLIEDPAEGHGQRRRRMRNDPARGGWCGEGGVETLTQRHKLGLTRTLGSMTRRGSPTDCRSPASLSAVRADPRAYPAVPCGRAPPACPGRFLAAGQGRVQRPAVDEAPTPGDRATKPGWTSQSQRDRCVCARSTPRPRSLTGPSARADADASSRPLHNFGTNCGGSVRMALFRVPRCRHNHAPRAG